MPIKQGAKPKNQESEIKEVKKLLDQNLEITRDLQERVQKIHRYIKWQRSFTIVKILIIIIPVVLSIIYLPAILQDVLKPYQELLGGAQSLNGISGGVDINSLLNGL